jgi:hypothetical protein
MVARRERFSGNILLYDYLAAKRAPVFLNRNLTRVLGVHKHIQRDSGTRNIAGSNHALRAVWEPPSWDDLDAMMDNKNLHGSLVLEIFSVKSTCKTDAEYLERNPKKARVLSRAKGVIQVSIFPPASDLPSFNSPAQLATLQSVVREREPNVLVETDSIAIRPNAFEISNPRIHLNDKHKLKISLDLDSQDEAEELFQHLNTRSVDGCSTRFTTACDNILECPSGRIILPLRDYKGGLDFGLEVSMHWVISKGIPILAAHNTRLTALAQPESYPSPPPDPDASRSSVKLMFVYANETITRTSLRCPHEGCSRRKPKNIDDLRMHLDSWHDLIKYQATLSHDDDGNEVWVFESEVADHKSEQRASARANEPFDIRNLAPSEPFDEQKYLNEGNDDYQRMSRLEKRHPLYRPALPVPDTIPVPPRQKPPDLVADMPPRDKRKHPVPQAPVGITFLRSMSRRPLRTGEYISESDDEVDDTWITLRKRAELNKDELLADDLKKFLECFDSHMWKEQLRSDIHLGDAIIRFAREKAAWIWQEDLFSTFMLKINELLEDRLISQEVHASCQEIVQAQSQHAAMGGAPDLSQRLAELEVKPTLQDALREDSSSRHSSAHEKASKKESLGSGPRKVNHKSGRARITETGIMTPITADSDGDLEMRDSAFDTKAVDKDSDHDTAGSLLYDLCICGSDAQRSRAHISCTHMVRTIQQCKAQRLTLIGLHPATLPLRLHQGAMEDRARSSYP